MGYLIAPERLETPDFVVRCYLPGDGPLLAEAVNASYEHLAPWMPWAKPEQSVDESERLVRRFRAHYLLAEDFALGVFDVPEERLLGGSGFHLREGGLVSGSAEIGMWIRSDAAGLGLGTRLLRAMLAWGFDAWPFVRLSWRSDRNNLASTRVATKAGMVQEGVLRNQHAHLGNGRRDTVCFAALAGEWTP